MNTSTGDEVARLRAAELEAERFHGEAVKVPDMTAARNAAERWRQAAAALTQCMTQHRPAHQDRGSNR